MLKNGFYNVVGGIIRMGINLLLVPLLIHALGVAMYGLWVVVVAFLGLAGLFECGVPLTTTVFGAKYLGNGDSNQLAKTFTLGVAISLIFGILSIGFVYFNSVQVNLFFPYLLPDQVQNISKALQVGGVLVCIRIIQQNLVGWQQAYQEYAFLNILDTIQTTFNNLGILAIAQSGGELVEMVMWQIGVSSCMVSCHIWNCYRLIKVDNLSPLWDFKMLKEFLHFSSMSWLGSLGGNLFSQADKLIVGSILGANTVAIYSVITTISVQINALSALPVQPMVPTISGLIHQENVDHETLKEQIRRGFELSVIVAFGIGAVLMTLAPLVMFILVPSHTSQDVYGLQLGIVMYVSYSINAVGYYILLGVDAVSTCTLIQSIGAIVSIISIGIGSIHFGLMGAIAGNGGYALIIFMTVFGMKFLNIPWRDWAGWLKIPGAWFICCCLVAVALPNSFSLRILVAIAQSVIFLNLLIRSQKMGKDL